MSTRPLVSVVVPTRNRCGLLGGALSALVEQDAGGIPYEIVVVDNNSSDDTVAVVRRFQRGAGGILKYVSERREGVSYARNTGIAAARGDIVSFTDDDIRVDPRWISTATQQLAEHRRIDYVGGPVLPRWTIAPPTWLTREHWSPIAAVDYGALAFDVPGDRPVCLITANLFIRRAALERVRWFDPGFLRCQDRELLLRLWAAGMRGLYVPDVVTHTEVPPERMTRAYHRRWHQMHGHFLARMPLRERRVDGDWIVESSAHGRFFLGVPLFEFHAFLTHLAGWCGATVTRRGEDAFVHELQLRYSIGFVLAAIRRRSMHPAGERRMSEGDRRQRARSAGLQSAKAARQRKSDSVDHAEVLVPRQAAPRLHLDRA